MNWRSSLPLVLEVYLPSGLVIQWYNNIHDFVGLVYFPQWKWSGIFSSGIDM